MADKEFRRRRKSVRCGSLLALVVAALLTAGCAGPVLQRSPARFQAPALHDGYVAMGDGYRLPLSRWMPDGDPQAVVLALHGFNDYRRAFYDLGRFLARRGIATYAYDQRGFGGSPHRGIWPGSERLVEDAGQVLRRLHRRYPGVPVYLLGESMGGAVALSLAAEPGAPGTDGLILAAPAVWGRQSMNVFIRTALWIGVRTAPGHLWTGRNLDIHPTDNQSVLRAMARDPLVIKATRTDALWGVTNLMDRASEAAAHITQPSLVLYGEQDDIIPKPPTCRMLRRLPEVVDATVALYPHGYHMLLRDREADDVMADVAAWMAHPRRQLPAADYRAPRGAWRDVLCGDSNAGAADVDLRQSRPHSNP